MAAGLRPFPQLLQRRMQYLLIGSLGQGHVLDRLPVLELSGAKTVCNYPTFYSVTLVIDLDLPSPYIKIMH